MKPHLLRQRGSAWNSFSTTFRSSGAGAGRQTNHSSRRCQMSDGVDRRSIIEGAAKCLSETKVLLERRRQERWQYHRQLVDAALFEDLSSDPGRALAGLSAPE